MNNTSLFQLAEFHNIDASRLFATVGNLLDSVNPDLILADVRISNNNRIDILEKFVVVTVAHASVRYY